MTSLITPEHIHQLNQNWKTIVSPYVMTAFGSTSEPQTEKETYKLGEIVAKIKTLQSEGKLICLFIGRTPHENLPAHTNEAKENEEWVSGDFALVSPEGHEELKGSPEMHHRLHLWFDFNEQEGLQLIAGLFDKVVIDTSTTKGLEQDFAKRFAILLRSKESEMIFEACGTFLLGLDKQMRFDESKYRLTLPMEKYYKKNEEMEAFYQDYIQSKTEEELQSEKEKFAEISDFGEWSEDLEDLFMPYIAKKNGKGGDYWAWDKTTKKVKSHLKSLYNCIEEHRNENYPYTTRHSARNHTDHYFIVRNPRF